MFQGILLTGRDKRKTTETSVTRPIFVKFALLINSGASPLQLCSFLIWQLRPRTRGSLPPRPYMPSRRGVLV